MSVFQLEFDESPTEIGEVKIIILSKIFLHNNLRESCLVGSGMLDKNRHKSITRATC